MALIKCIALFKVNDTMIITINNESEGKYMDSTNANNMEVLRRLMLLFLMEQVLTKDYSVLVKMYEMTRIDNEKMVNKAHTIRNIFASPSETIFSDMVYIIYEESKTNTAVFQYFYELVAPMFPKKVRQHEEMVKIYENTPEKVPDYLVDVYFDYQSSRLLYYFMLYIPLYLDNAIFVNSAVEYYTKAAVEAENRFLLTDKDIDDDIYVFNSEETIFPSVQFERYLEKRKEELATYLSELYNTKVTVDYLATFISKTLKSRAEATGCSVSDCVDSIVTRTVCNVLVEQYGGQTWYERITNDGKTGYQNAQKYKPNVDKIIRIYFKEFVKHEWRKYYKMHDEGFSKVFMSRDCVPESMKEAYLGIMYLYNIDVMCKLFNDVKDDYYLNFSWEKISNRDMIARYNLIISDLEDSIKSLNSRLAVALEEKDLLQCNYRQERHFDDMELNYERNISYLSKKIEKKDDEIISLRRELESKDEYIKLLVAQEDVEPEREIDIALLQQKRYLFVGYAKEALPELRRTFPNSIFMESEGTSLNNIQVDGIVMLIKYMSHSMYYKVTGASVAKTVPIVRCNTKNINTIYAKMMELQM